MTIKEMKEAKKQKQEVLEPIKEEPKKEIVENIIKDVEPIVPQVAVAAPPPPKQKVIFNTRKNRRNDFF